MNGRRNVRKNYDKKSAIGNINLTNKKSIAKIIDPVSYKNWNELIQEFPAYSFFHSFEWSKVLSKTYHYKPVYFCLFNNDRLSSLVPAMEIRSKLTGKRLVSLPFSDFCEPLLSSIDESELLKKLIFDYCKNNKLKFIEFRTSEIRFPFDTQEFRTDLRHILRLSPDSAELKRNFSENTKRNIKSAVKTGLKIREDNSWNSLKNFYDLQSVTRKKHGLPPQPKLFFDNIYKHIISQNKGSMFFAYFDNKPVASLMFLTIGKKVLYKFGASINNNLPKGANHLLMWEAIKKYSKDGYKELDLGRTETNHEGLRRYKLGFGAEERIIYTTRFSFKANAFVAADSKTNGFYNKIFRNMPIPVLKIVGNTLYKHIG